MAGDGCAAGCDAVERDFACLVPGQAWVSTVVCGDGRISGAETCHDGNAVAQDGCSDHCAVEAGWACPALGARCVAAACGDGIIAGAESCEDDDGPVPVSGDGCSDTCRVEPGWVCDAPLAACRRTVCGDGIAEGIEPCDDGNQIVGDGCNPFCEVEPQCSQGPCTSVCGDGMILPTDSEQSDDGNRRSGDGCSSTCTIESGFSCTRVTSEPPDPLEFPVVFGDFISLPMAAGVKHPGVSRDGTRASGRCRWPTGALPRSRRRPSR